MKLWTKDFMLDSLTNLFLYIVFYLLVVTVTPYATDRFQASPSEAGLASGIFIIGVLIGRFYTGRAIDRIGRKKTLYIGLVIYLGVTGLYFAVHSLSALILIRLLHGIGFGMAATATGTIAVTLIPRERYGEGISYFAMSVAFGSAVGPLFGLYMIQHGSFTMILILAGLLLTASLASAFIMKTPEEERGGRHPEPMKGLSVHSFLSATAIPISVVALFMGLGISSVLSFFASYAREIALTDVGSFFFTVYALVMLLTRPFTGRLFDRAGDNVVMYPSFLFFALGLVVLSQAGHGVILLLAAVFIGLGYGTFVSSAQAIAVRSSPRNRVGLATSTYFIFLDVGAGLGPYLLGMLIPATGFRGVYLGATGVVLACIVLYYFLHGRKTASPAGTR